MIRTALFNWAYARHTGGSFVFRIEDTDAARDSEESYQQIIDAMRWLGLDWDEGVECGGAHAPYRQSQRAEVYRAIIDRLVAEGYVYESFSTAAEIDARNIAAGRPQQLGYDNYDRALSEQQKQQFRAEGRAAALRFRMPDGDLDFDDLVRGHIIFPRASNSDFVVVRPGGAPLYTLTNPVDDALMGITHVLRGEDLLSSTPRQIALHCALVELGFSREVPQFGHLPYVMGAGNKKLSKRDPESNLLQHRERGFIPEGLINYLSLLGWSLSADRDVFDRDELVAAFDVTKVNPNPARFDQKKADAINAAQIRLLSPDEFARRALPYLVAGGVLPAEPSAAQLAMLRAAAPLVHSRVTVLSELVGMMGFLFTSTAQLEHTEDALRSLAPNAAQVLAAGLAALETVGEHQWQTEAIRAALQTSVVDGLALKPRLAFGALRVAVSGRRVSPPLFESCALLGRDETLARLRRLLNLLDADEPTR